MGDPYKDSMADPGGRAMSNDPSHGTWTDNQEERFQSGEPKAIDEYARYMEAQEQQEPAMWMESPGGPDMIGLPMPQQGELYAPMPEVETMSETGMGGGTGSMLDVEYAGGEPIDIMRNQTDDSLMTSRQGVEDIAMPVDIYTPVVDLELVDPVAPHGGGFTPTSIATPDTMEVDVATSPTDFDDFKEEPMVEVTSFEPHMSQSGGGTAGMPAVEPVEVPVEFADPAATMNVRSFFREMLKVRTLTGGGKTSAMMKFHKYAPKSNYKTLAKSLQASDNWATGGGYRLNQFGYTNYGAKATARDKFVGRSKFANGAIDPRSKGGTKFPNGQAYGTTYKNLNAMTGVMEKRGMTAAAMQVALSKQLSKWTDKDLKEARRIILQSGALNDSWRKAIARGSGT